MVRKRMSREAKSARESHLKKLGKHIRELREAQNISREEMATSLGVTAQYIYMIETGRANPSEKRLTQLADVLGDMADEFRRTAGIVPDDARDVVSSDPDTYTEVLTSLDSFGDMLRAKGLSEEQVRTAIRNVPNQVIESVVAGDEELEVDWAAKTPDDFTDRMDAGEAVVMMTQDSPGEYILDALSVKGVLEDMEEDFSAPRGRMSRDSTLGASGVAARPPSADFESTTFSAPKKKKLFGKKAPSTSVGGSGTEEEEVIRAGSIATIKVNRRLTQEERSVLENIAEVIRHALTKT